MADNGARSDLYGRPIRLPMSFQLECIMASSLSNDRIPRMNVAAKELGMSPRTLARKLTKEGTTFNAVMLQIRIHLARAYLVNSDMQITQIAWRVGFKESASFSNAFKKWLGISPRELREASNA